MKDPEKTTLAARFRGCLLGGAAGDALGAPVEFLTDGEIRRRYGAQGITAYDPEPGRGLALITDDTQMTLFTAAALIAAAGAGETDYVPFLHRSYLDWLGTQDRTKKAAAPRLSSLGDVPELNHRRAPGSTCLFSLASGDTGSVAVPINNSKGCGGVMRAAPAGLFAGIRGGDPDFAARLGADSAAITHGHPLGWIPSAMFAEMIARITYRGESIRAAARAAADAARVRYAGFRDTAAAVSLVGNALAYADGDLSDADALFRLGEGWVAEETLAVAVFCAARYEKDFSAALRTAVNHSGDSDSTGAVCGNLLGALYGDAAIPPEWTERLELRGLIENWAEKLLAATQIGEK